MWCDAMQTDYTSIGVAGMQCGFWVERTARGRESVWMTFLRGASGLSFRLEASVGRYGSMQVACMDWLLGLGVLRERTESA